jgi:hypothetical protein
MELLAWVSGLDGLGGEIGTDFSHLSGLGKFGSASHQKTKTPCSLLGAFEECSLRCKKNQLWAPS